MRGLAGKVAVVTGAAGGIGRATAVRLAEEEATVVCIDVIPDAVHELAATLGGTATGRALDVRDEAAVHGAITEVVERFGRIDILANAHGVYRQGVNGQGPIEADTTSDWDTVLGVNLMGVVHTSRAALEHMKRQRSGRIITVASAAAIVGGYACSASYAVSKAGVVCLMKCVAREGAPFGVTANAVAPGQIDTAMTQVVLERVPLEAIVERTPLGRLGAPGEVASAIVFLSSDDASFVTGQTISVNGGILMI